MRVFSKAGRLVLRRRGDDGFLRVVIRSGVPDALHIDRAFAPTVSIYDDRRLVTGRQDECAYAKTRQLVLTLDRSTQLRRLTRALYGV